MRGHRSFAAVRFKFEPFVPRPSGTGNNPRSCLRIAVVKGYGLDIARLVQDSNNAGFKGGYAKIDCVVSKEAQA